MCSCDSLLVLNRVGECDWFTEVMLVFLRLRQTVVTALLCSINLQVAL